MILRLASFLALAMFTTAAVAADVESITIEALIDGPTALKVRPKTIYWHNGGNAKPGKSDFADEPTYVNGDAWKPRWKKRDASRGEDTSNYYSISLGTTDLKVELLSVGNVRGQPGIERRTPITTSVNGNEFIISIPDPENGARWYKFIITKNKQP